MADKPSHDVFVVEGEGEKAYWTKVGGAWKLKDKDGYSGKINTGIAIHGRFVILPRKEDDKEG